MRRMLAALMAGTLIHCAMYFVVRAQKTPEANSKPEAKRLWDLAVNAKGGRERLEQVNSLAVFYEYFKGHPSVELYVFPNKRWDWYDTSSSHTYPLEAYGLDFEKKIHCVNHRYVSEGCEPIGNFSKRGYLEDPQLLYLLETKWVKPELLAASKGALGIRSVDIVKVQLEIFQISVYLDSKTHLPQRIAYHVNEGGRFLKAGDIFQWYGLSDYRDVNGIMMPHKISHTDSQTRHIRYEINPAYDPGVFTRKPDLSAGPEQWRGVAKVSK